VAVEEEEDDMEEGEEEGGVDSIPGLVGVGFG